ncbi:beta-1,4-glucuronyltransferase 1 [Copidosoma floridanum]|uniref:beta-1,4-glucuronyltransferase 1 n=1 Tax=Copidosoma floridanum TaxID=29053 RepID=UPI0006C96A63|nr:beta-1,4-glucuronyltransferase 1 [Copidosoma floridanum]
MVQLGCRPWNLSLVSVIVLGLTNMLLTFLLLQSESCGRYRFLVASAPEDRTPPAAIGRPVAKQPCPEDTTSTDATGQEGEEDEGDTYGGEQLLQKLDVRLGRWDSRRLLQAFDAALVGTQFAELSSRARVCLATQSSLEKLGSLVQVVHQWTGPLSVALYAAGDEEFDLLQRYLAYLRRCYEPIRQRVNFSLAVPRGRPLLLRGSGEQRQGPQDSLDCRRPEGTLAELVRRLSAEQLSWRSRNPYPQNHMRNLARKNCQSEYVFLTDVDIVPSTNLSRQLEDFLAQPEQSRCERCAYVVPTYELDARVRFPQNKTELARLARKGLARPFHQKVFIHNQFATNFTRWMLDVGPGHASHENVRTGRAYVSHEVTNFEFLYEPFYVARDVAPPHDERFMGYGYTRNTQVYEMYVAGYKFKVLSPTFTVHWGLQTRKSRPAWRERQNSLNRKHFEVFKKEVFARYTRDPLKMLKSHN